MIDYASSWQYPLSQLQGLIIHGLSPTTRALLLVVLNLNHLLQTWEWEEKK